MGVVYKARHLRLKRLVAVKVVLAGGHAGAAERARFQTEGEAVARLQHPNVVQVFDVGEHQGLPYLAMELVEGGSLAARVGDAPIPAAEAAALVRALASAVQAAHDARVVHRDLKPANVLLASDGTPKVTDFGLAKKLDDAGQTTTGVIMGTPSYMAPEQAAGKAKDVGPAADIWALGAVLYKLLTGRPPFQAATTMDTLVQVLSNEPVPPRRANPAVPRDLETICLKCLEKDARSRYSSARALGDDLTAFLRDEPISAHPPRLLTRLSRWARARPALAATLVALAALYCNHLALIALGVSGEGGDFHVFATWLTLTWAAGAVGFQWLVSRPRWNRPGTYAWAALDVVMLTVLLMRGDGPRSALLVAYLLLIAGTSLRFRVALVWFVTGICLVSYLGMVAHTAWWRPALAVGVKESMIFSLSLLILGALQHQLLLRIRAANGPEKRD
jgi:serine/threonine-protein kinase